MVIATGDGQTRQQQGERRQDTDDACIHGGFTPL
jgi:hypothetical protein